MEGDPFCGRSLPTPHWLVVDRRSVVVSTVGQGNVYYLPPTGKHNLPNITIITILLIIAITITITIIIIITIISTVYNLALFQGDNYICT